MKERVVIIGGGTGGTLVANRLRKAAGTEALAITVIDRDDRHVYQPGLLFVPFGSHPTEELVRSRRAQLHEGIDFVESDVDSVDVANSEVRLVGGRRVAYDALVIASGSSLLPEETAGLTGDGWNETVATFYTLEGAQALAAALAKLEAGRLVINVVDLPIKCPVAPLEFAFLADAYLQKRGLRDRVEITYVTPLDGAFTKPVASHTLGSLLERKGIHLVTEFNTGEADGAKGSLKSYDGREVAFDLAAVVPLHGGAGFVGRSPGLGDELNFVPADDFTLQATAAHNIFVMGDAAALPISKAGSVAHFQGPTIVENVQRLLGGKPLAASFDGHVNCFVETGFGKALLIDFNYDTEPLPGHFPTALGLPLLKESRLNHLGKLMFEWLYWHMLLPGFDLPGLSSTMPESGKSHVTTGVSG